MKRWIIIASTVILLLVLAYALMAWQTAKAPEGAVVEEIRAYDVSLETSYDDGIHTISGIILADTPCQEVSASGVVGGSGIRLDISLPPETGVCLRRQTERSFEVTVEAPEEATIAVFVNGKATQPHD